jgi:hypothetical protein
LIVSAQNALPITAGLGAKARKRALGHQGAPLELLTEVANFLVEHGASYPTFDAQEVKNAAELEQSLTQVVGRAALLIDRAKNTILEHRAPAVEQSLALYAMLKAQSRTDATARGMVTRLEPLVNSRKAPHQKKTQREAAKAKKAAGATPAKPSPKATTDAGMTAETAVAVPAPAVVTPHA